MAYRSSNLWARNKEERVSAMRTEPIGTICKTMISDTDAARYDAIYMKGGHGICFDFPKSRELASVAAKLYESGKIGSAVCQGPAGEMANISSRGSNQKAS